MPTAPLHACDSVHPHDHCSRVSGSQFGAALPALCATSGVQGTARGAGHIHGSSEQVRDDGADAEDRNDQPDAQQHLAHGLLLSQGGAGGTDGLKVFAGVSRNNFQLTLA
jgi:hypothetical protein